MGLTLWHFLLYPGGSISQDPQDVGGAGVAATVFADVDAAQSATDEHTRRYRSEEIPDSDGGNSEHARNAVRAYCSKIRRTSADGS